MPICWHMLINVHVRHNRAYLFVCIYIPLLRSGWAQPLVPHTALLSVCDFRPEWHFFFSLTSRKTQNVGEDDTRWLHYSSCAKHNQFICFSGSRWQDTLDVPTDGCCCCYQGKARRRAWVRRRSGKFPLYIYIYIYIYEGKSHTYVCMHVYIHTLDCTVSLETPLHANVVWV